MNKFVEYSLHLFIFNYLLQYFFWYDNEFHIILLLKFVNNYMLLYNLPWKGL